MEVCSGPGSGLLWTRVRVRVRVRLRVTVRTVAPHKCMVSMVVNAAVGDEADAGAA